MTIPGVQNPHCTASCSMKAACTGCSASPARGPRSCDLRVRRHRSPASCTKQTGAPSSQTVQAEHAPRSHPILMPVRPRVPRNASASVARGSTRGDRAIPLTSSMMGIVSAAAVAELASCAIALSLSVARATPMMAACAAVRVENSRNERRDNPEPSPPGALLASPSRRRDTCFSMRWGGIFSIHRISPQYRDGDPRAPRKSLIAIDPSHRLDLSQPRRRGQEFGGKLR